MSNTQETERGRATVANRGLLATIEEATKKLNGVAFDLPVGTQIPDTPITVAALKITPSMAAGLLKKNVRNRAVRPANVLKVARAIKIGSFMTTHQGIAFDSKGVLIDGQHRLLAIVWANKPATLLVFQGLPMKTQFVVDVGTKRAIQDTLRAVDGIEMSAGMAAVAKAMFSGFRCDPQPADELALRAFIQHHAEALAFVTGFYNGKGYAMRAQVAAVWARAFYTAKRDDLLEFIDCYLTGQATNKRQRNAILLRDFVIRSGGRGGSSHRAETYRKSSRALQAFLSGTQLTRLYEATEEYFLLPEEKK